MKVLQILPELNSGGVERGTLEVSAYLVDNGHEALVVSNGGRLVEQLEKSGARHIEMPVHRKHPRSLLEVKKLRKLLETEAPDILHIRSRLPGWIAYLAWRKMDPATRPRLVSTVHGFYSVNRYSAVMTKGERVIAVSESIKNYILANYPEVDESDISVIHRGVSPKQFSRGYQPSEEWLRQWKSIFPTISDKTVLLLPGRITRWKGQEDFVRLVSSLKRDGMDVYGIIVGETHPKKKEFESELRALVEKLDVSSNLSFLGHRDDVREVMAASDLVLSLSRQPEAFGRVSLEAMSLGKPVVAYDHGGVGEQLRVLFPDGLVSPKDEAALLEKVKSICSQRFEVAPIEGSFTREGMLASILEVYKAVTKGN